MSTTTVLDLSNPEQSSNVKYWEQQKADISNISDGFKNARDIGVARLNYTRLNLVGDLPEKDEVDYYKFNVISNGRLRFTLRDGSQAEDAKNSKGPLDLSKYDPPKTKEELDKEAEENLKSIEDAIKPKYVRAQIYSTIGGREKLIADSDAEEGSKLREAYEQMAVGEYRIAQKGNYYMKVTRKEGVSKDSDIQYAAQIQIGKDHKHDYMTIETKEKASSISPNVLTGGRSLTPAAQIALDNAVQLSSISLGSAASSILSDGLYSMANIYTKNKVNLFG